MPEPTSPEERARERFVDDTARHVMTVKHDDGLYRHVRYQRPGDSAYWYDLVTWPGFLAITGDMGAWLFARTPDMFSFFGERPSINPHYWSGKLQTEGGRRQATVYSADVYRRSVQEWLDEQADELSPAEADELRAAAHEDLLPPWGEWENSEHDAHERLRDFEHEGIRISDSWEWSLREYDYGFLWCCWAIVTGIKQWRAALEAAHVE